MGGGGGFFPSNLKPKDIQKEVEKSLDKTKKEEFEVKAANLTRDLLIQYNDRNPRKIQDKLDKVKKIIEKDIKDTIDLKFGGSISKHTYVDGLSDVDTLILVNNTELMNKTPEQIQDFFLSKLRKELKDIKKVDKGTLAVTLEFKDGTVIQLLPAIQVGDRFKIASPDGKRWSEINPKGFTAHLTRINKTLGGKVVPAVKIVKSINAQFPETRQMTGYHIESLAIEAFKSYSGEKTPKALIEHFFNKTRDLVLSPIRDKSKQSIHVDDYLGLKNSDARKSISHQIDIVCRKIRSANNTNSIPSWKEILGEL